jgi:hypothetical protein
MKVRKENRAFGFLGDTKGARSVQLLASLALIFYFDAVAYGIWHLLFYMEFERRGERYDGIAWEQRPRIIAYYALGFVARSTWSHRWELGYGGIIHLKWRSVGFAARLHPL